VLVTPRAKRLTKRLPSCGASSRDGAKSTATPTRSSKYHAKYIVADDGPALRRVAELHAQCFASTDRLLVTTSDPWW